MRADARDAGKEEVPVQADERGGTVGPAGLAQMCVLIPAWKPEERLLELVRRLVEDGMGRVLVVDDGSGPGYAALFARLEPTGRVEVLRHARNRGKGCALKTGFAHLLAAPEACSGVVTADADGQHTAEDIVRVAHVLLRSGARPVLGVRRFRKGVPLLNRVGNEAMRGMFRVLTGVRLRDTQTGLRGLRTALLPALMEVRGERYEYEMAMLATLCRTGPRPVEVPIATVYLEGNRSSHFHPLWDSVRVYAVLWRCVVTAWARRR